jgi:hypothetical protein
MPAEGVALTPNQRLLSTPEIMRLVSFLGEREALQSYENGRALQLPLNCMPIFVCSSSVDPLPLFVDATYVKHLAQSA